MRTASIASLLWDYLPLNPEDGLGEQELALAPEAPPQGLGGDPDQDDDKTNPQDAGTDDESQGDPQDPEEDLEPEDPDGDGDDGDEPEDYDDDFTPEPVEHEPAQYEPVIEPFAPGPKPIPGFHRDGDNGDNYIRDFDSWWDFVQSAHSDPSSWTTRSSQEPEKGQGRHAGKGWYGTASFAEAIEMASATGWPEGRAMLRDAIVAIPPRPRTFASLELEVAGAFPLVAAYCAGDPACMVIDPGANLRNQKPVIRIDYNHWIHAGITPQEMMLRGAAIVSLANSLEEQSFSTELRIVGNSRAHGKTFRYNIVFKKAGELLDLDRAAFAIAHPSSMRRLAFAILEQHPDLEPDFSHGYGAPCNEPNDPTSGQFNGAVFVPGAHSRETAETAWAAVERAAATLLNSMAAEGTSEAAD